jgi:hypothetical protein
MKHRKEMIGSILLIFFFLFPTASVTAAPSGALVKAVGKNFDLEMGDQLGYEVDINFNLQANSVLATALALMITEVTDGNITLDSGDITNILSELSNLISMSFQLKLSSDHMESYGDNWRASDLIRGYLDFRADSSDNWGSPGDIIRQNIKPGLVNLYQNYGLSSMTDFPTNNDFQQQIDYMAAMLDISYTSPNFTMSGWTVNDYDKYWGDGPDTFDDGHPNGGPWILPTDWSFQAIMDDLSNNWNALPGNNPFSSFAEALATLGFVLSTSKTSLSFDAILENAQLDWMDELTGIPNTAQVGMDFIGLNDYNGVVSVDLDYYNNMTLRSLDVLLDGWFNWTIPENVLFERANELMLGDHEEIGYYYEHPDGGPFIEEWDNDGVRYDYVGENFWDVGENNGPFLWQEWDNGYNYVGQDYYYVGPSNGEYIWDGYGYTYVGLYNGDFMWGWLGNHDGYYYGDYRYQFEYMNPVGSQKGEFVYNVSRGTYDVYNKTVFDWVGRDYTNVGPNNGEYTYNSSTGEYHHVGILPNLTYVGWGNGEYELCSECGYHSNVYNYTWINVGAGNGPYVATNENWNDMDGYLLIGHAFTPVSWGSGDYIDSGYDYYYEDPSDIGHNYNHYTYVGENNGNYVKSSSFLGNYERGTRQMAGNYNRTGDDYYGGDYAPAYNITADWKQVRNMSTGFETFVYVGPNNGGTHWRSDVLDGYDLNGTVLDFVLDISLTHFGIPEPVGPVDSPGIPGYPLFVMALISMISVYSLLKKRNH